MLIIETLLKWQIERWMFAAKQDRDPYVAMLHVNYAVGNSILLGEMFPPGYVKRVTGMDPTGSIEELVMHKMWSRRGWVKATGSRKSDWRSYAAT